VPRDGSVNRTRILDAAETLVIAHGFAATSVDAVIDAAGTTKGGFFHHFPSKGDLGRALVERYAAEDAVVLDELLERAERLARDPLQQLLVFVGLLADEVEAAMRVAPGCLFASFCYERELVDAETRALIESSLRLWGDRIEAKLQAAAAAYPPRVEVDLRALADQVTTLVEGAYVMVRALGDATFVRGQLEQLRSYLELLFDPHPAARSSSPAAAA
jgi:TetR/AcrR family transcriptional repressor of nem operon